MQDSHNQPAGGAVSPPSPPLTVVSSAAVGLPEQLSGRVDRHLERFLEQMREGLVAASTAVGLEVMAELMETEVTEIAGPRGKHNARRRAMRHGSEPGSVTLGGRRLEVCRPRVRGVEARGGEIRLESYQTFTSTDLLSEGVVARMLAGLSTRRYGAGLEPVGSEVVEKSKGTSKSAVSRRFVSATADRVGELMRRPLSDRRWLVVYLDGFGMGDHLMVGALGVSEDGTKVPLGVVEGTTENAAVCTRLVGDLRDRGLDASQGALFVIDGGKAASHAIQSVFGDQALIQRCRAHKERNVVEHLPEAERPLVQRRLRSAWALPDAEQAEKELKELANHLSKQHPGAAASLREGLQQTLTITRLGVSGKLRGTLGSTNPMESMIEIVRDHSRRVKRWSSGEMALRWSAAGMLAAERQFRRVRGYQELPTLARALESEVGAAAWKDQLAAG